jgi:molybdopterin-guanine dinucleotide biosynthesis protein
MSDFEMRPLIIGIAGGHSGSGKTFIGCKLLERLPGWGAIKYTKTSLYGSVTDDIDVLSEEGKDTKKFLDSGAGKVLWVRSPLHELADTLPVAVEMLSHLNGIIVEGNSAVDVLMPDIVIFITGPEAKMKEGSEKILRIADVVVSDSALPEAPQNAKIFRIDEVEGILDYVSKLVKEKDKG